MCPCVLLCRWLLFKITFENNHASLLAVLGQISLSLFFFFCSSPTFNNSILRGSRLEEEGKRNSEKRLTPCQCSKVWEAYTAFLVQSLENCGFESCSSV